MVVDVTSGSRSLLFEVSYAILEISTYVNVCTHTMIKRHLRSHREAPLTCVLDSYQQVCPVPPQLGARPCSHPEALPLRHTEMMRVLCTVLLKIAVTMAHYHTQSVDSQNVPYHTHLIGEKTKALKILLIFSKVTQLANKGAVICFGLSGTSSPILSCKQGAMV